MWALRLAVVWLTAVMLVQPAADHHLSERVPGHLHWPSLSGAALDGHLHFYEINHHHSHGASLPNGAQAAGEHVWPSSGLPGEQVSPDTLIAPPRGDALLIALTAFHHPSGTPVPPAGVTVAPPIPPPVAV